MLNKTIKFFLDNKLITTILLVVILAWGVITSPFNWDTGILPSNPVPVDAIPDIGENQQIVFTEWQGRSPQDIEDQISYPLTTSLLGIPGVKTIRSSSMFGFSSIYIIFKEDVEFYWSRSRILEKINSLPNGTLPDGVQPTLGPDATALGQIFWYTLEGRDSLDKSTGGWDLHELRSTQDYLVKYALSSADGVSEVASIGGYVKEYQIDVNPNALKTYNISLEQVINSVKKSNRDVGARTIEINNAEYLVRGLGYITSIEDIEKAVVSSKDNIPIRIKDIATVRIGPSTRRGILDKSGAEAVGGVIVARYGSNPLEVINNVKEKITEIEKGMPSKVLDDGTVSKIKIVPFYDRTQLIKETIGTLEEALFLEILITIIVVIVMVMNLRGSILISGVLPIAVLMTFIAMQYLNVDANIVALSGIAIAIGTMVDMAIVIVENILRHLKSAQPGTSVKDTVFKATSEVASAVLTAVLTTIVSFIPVFTMQGAEGKLFIPLAFTKSFALIAAILVALIFIPMFAHWIFSIKFNKKRIRQYVNGILVIAGIIIAICFFMSYGIIIAVFGLVGLAGTFIPDSNKKYIQWITNGISVLTVTYILTNVWLPLGPGSSFLINFIFVAGLLAGLLSLFIVIIRIYPSILKWSLANKKTFLLIPSLFLFFGVMIWFGFNNMFGFVADGFNKAGFDIKPTKVWSAMAHAFPGVGKEFMPSLDEGSFLLMPTSMPHTGVEENKKILAQLDMAVTAIPEVESVVGKAGRVESSLDPAPLSMFENVINYKSEYKTDEQGNRLRFAVDKSGSYLRDDYGNLVEAPDGKYFRQWREHIHSTDDIWQEIVKATKLPAITSAPKLQPIETRLVMLQTGMRAPMGIKVTGPDLKTIESFGLQLESILKEVPSVKIEAVFADRVVGKPYIQLKINRDAIARYNLTVEDVQIYIETAIGGMTLTNTVEGRERYPVRVRYPRELRNSPSTIKKVLVATKSGIQIPLGELVDIEYVQGPQVIKSENTFKISYVLFDKKKEYAEVDVVEQAQKYIDEQIASKRLNVPDGVSFAFTGTYENQVRAEKTLSFVVPLVLLLIFLILYLQFKSVPTTLMVFTGIAVAFAGGFMMIWFYGQDWFMNFSLFGSNMRNLFQMDTVNLSVAVWVGFIALFGIATDDGVVMATYLKQSFDKLTPKTKQEIREAVVIAGSRRIRPCLMTTATTVLALLPVLTSTGRGADVMVPMAIPSFGGMSIELITLFVVPILYSMWQEAKLKRNLKNNDHEIGI